MQGSSENWVLPQRPAVKVKLNYPNGIKLQNKFSDFNNEKYFNTEIDQTVKEDVIRTKNKTNKKMEYAKSFSKKSEKRIRVIYQSLKAVKNQEKKMVKHLSEVPAFNGVLSLKDESDDSIKTEENILVKEKVHKRYGNKRLQKNVPLTNRFAVFQNLSETQIEAILLGEDLKTERNHIPRLPKNNPVANRFKDFQKHIESQIEIIFIGEKVQDSTSCKIKCRKCGYKKKCMKNNSCQAKNKCCTFCLKLNHFPKSLNCKKQRKTRRKKISLEQNI